MYAYTNDQWEALRGVAALALQHLIRAGSSRSDIAQVLRTTQRTLGHVESHRPTKTRVLWDLVDTAPATVGEAEGLRERLPARVGGPDVAGPEALAERRRMRETARATSLKVRKQQGLTQHALAARLGVSQSTICFVESMNVRVSEQTLREIIDLDNLEPREGPQQAAE